jgi:hypothetical protein
MCMPSRPESPSPPPNRRASWKKLDDRQLGDPGTQGPLDHERADSRKAQTSHRLPTFPPRISRATSTAPSSSIEVYLFEMMGAASCHEIAATMVDR